MGPKHGGRGGAGADAVDMDTGELQLGFAGPPQPALCLRILQSSSRLKWEGSWGFREKDSCSQELAVGSSDRHTLSWELRPPSMK